MSESSGPIVGAGKKCAYVRRVGALTPGLRSRPVASRRLSDVICTPDEPVRSRRTSRPRSANRPNSEWRPTELPSCNHTWPRQTLVARGTPGDSAPAAGPLFQAARNRNAFTSPAHRLALHLPHPVGTRPELWTADTRCVDADSRRRNRSGVGDDGAIAPNSSGCPERDDSFQGSPSPSLQRARREAVTQVLEPRISTRRAGSRLAHQVPPTLAPPRSASRRQPGRSQLYSAYSPPTRAY